MIESYLAIPPILGVLGLLVALGIFLVMNSFPEGDEKVKKIGDQIHLGAMTFMKTEYTYLSIFALVVIILVYLSLGQDTALAVLAGALSSSIAGWIGMYSATKANVRTATAASQSGAESALSVAFYGGSIMGLCVASLGLIGLGSLYYILSGDAHSIEGFAMGASIVALFSRVGGGIYTKSADVGADLVGKNGFNLPEDSPENPATIADNVGDNVGDIAGMGSDLFGSFAESTCAALVVSGTSQELIKGGNYYFPLMLSAGGILICIFTSFFATHFIPVTSVPRIEQTLRWQLIISSILLTPMIVLMSIYLLPSEFNFDTGKDLYRGTNWGVMICGLTGLWAGMIIGFFTDYFTSTEYRPVQKLADSCKSGAAINIIQGLALGYFSCIIPMICLASKYFINFLIIF